MKIRAIRNIQRVPIEMVTKKKKTLKHDFLLCYIRLIINYLQDYSISGKVMLLSKCSSQAEPNNEPKIKPNLSWNRIAVVTT